MDMLETLIMGHRRNSKLVCLTSITNGLEFQNGQFSFSLYHV